MDTTYAATCIAFLIFLASVISVEAALSAAIIPTFIAQRWFSPSLPEQVKEEVLAREEESP